MIVFGEDRRQVVHGDLDAALARVRAGRSTLYVPTQTRVTKITGVTLAAWEKRGLTVIRPDKDGRGFRLASGKSTVYVLPGQLWEVDG